jgi:putative hydrolase of the HAD superfamily
MQISTLFIDLDGTLYPEDNGVWDLISARMNQYIHEHFSIPLEKVSALRKEYYNQYGTSLRGLQHHYSVDAEDYLAYVHDVPLRKYIHPDPQLRAMFKKLPQTKWIITNSVRGHAHAVLLALGIDDLFNGVVDVLDTDYLPKPDPYVFQRALDMAGNPAPQSCMFLDDLPKNLRTAKDMGFITVLVGSKPPEDTHDYHIQRINQLADQILLLLE